MKYLDPFWSVKRCCRGMTGWELIAKAHIRAKGEHLFRVIKRHFGFQKTRLRGMLKDGCEVNVLAALANLFMARHLLLCKT